MSVLELQNIGLTLGDTPVLDDISIRVEPGEFVSILGPSGCGKSTIFRLLNGEIRPDRGQILLDGRVPVPGSFAFMPQRDALMPWRRIIDNVTLGLEVAGLGRRDARARALPHMAEFGLAGFERHFPDQLSGGMRQRAALLRTMILNKPVQLLDEPFGALDALTRAEMQRWLETRQQSRRLTTLLVTHDVREAVALSDRIYVLSPRPARVVTQMTIDAPRPRLGRPLPAVALAAEEQLLTTLLTRTETP